MSSKLPLIIHLLVFLSAFVYYVYSSPHYTAIQIIRDKRLAMLAGDQQCAPAARARITSAGAVGIDLNSFGQKRIRETRLVVSASPATTFGLRRHCGLTGVRVLTRFWAVSI